MTKDFSSLEGIDLEVYAGVDNIIHIDVSDDDGQRIQLEGGTYKAEKNARRVLHRRLWHPSMLGGMISTVR